MDTVTPNDIAARIHKFLLDNTHAPTISTVEDIISESQARVRGYMRGKGLDYLLDVDLDANEIARSAVIYLSVAQTEMARNRGDSDLADKSWQRAKEILDQIHKYPATMGPLNKANMPAQGSSRSSERCRPKDDLDIMLNRKEI